MDEKLKELFSKNLVNQLLAHGETQATMTRRMNTWVYLNNRINKHFSVLFT